MSAREENRLTEMLLDMTAAIAPPAPKFRTPAWHARCCDTFGVTASRDHDHWWRAAAHTRDGKLLFATGGRTRILAETNALNGAGAPMDSGRPEGRAHRPDEGMFFESDLGVTRKSAA